ncbi:MAG: hypothetical protein INR71_08685 [Terriglobus roseus]|nr:hypothetical protein [Terriglobus roseus]
MASSVPSSLASRTAGSSTRLVPRVESPADQRSFKLVAIKLITASKEHLEKHYADLSEKPFFKGLVTCTSAPASHK